MAAVPVIRPAKAEPPKPVTRPGFETPMVPGGLFSMNPFALMRQFTEDMDRFFGLTLHRMPEAIWTPAIEIKEKNGSLLVHAELPGMDAENIKVHIENNTLVLEGERREEKEERRESFYHSERRYGAFYRAIALPEKAKTDGVNAEFKKGVLEIAVPLAEPTAKRREIPVTESAKK